MTNGSIESRSSATSAVEFAGLRTSAIDGTNRSVYTAERFDSIFENLNSRSQTRQLEVEARVEPAFARAQEDAFVLDRQDDTQEIGAEAEHADRAEKADASASCEQDEGDDPVEVEDASRKAGQPAIETSNVPSEPKKPIVMNRKEVLQADGEVKNGKAAATQDGESPRAIKTTAEPRVSSSLSFRLQTQKTTVEKDGTAAKATVTPKPAQNATQTAVKADVAKSSLMSGVVDLSAAKATTTKTVTASKVDVKIAGEVSSKNGSPNKTGNSQSALAAKINAALGKTDVSEKAMDAPEAGAVKKTTHGSAKTSLSVPSTASQMEVDTLKNSLKAAGLVDETKLRTSENEIGIKAAEQVGSKINKMVAELKSSENTSPEKGFLKESSDTGALNRAQAVNSRSETSGGFFNNGQSQHGNGFGSEQGQSNRGGEQLRQWVEGNSEVKGVSQAAQQSELVDRNVGSMLSARVLNQIVNHIERLRESDKNRVKVSLGSEANGVTVDIRIEGSAIYTSFEGDADILNQLKDDWDDIKDRAARKGVSLKDPEFNSISYSSSSESASFLPDDGLEKEGKSQSVIQHINNQPVRPGKMTAAAGSSGPVHSYA